MRWILLLAALAGPAGSPAERGATDLLQVTAVRHWSLPATTRVVIEVNGPFRFHSDRLHNPERVFFDIFRSRPLIESRKQLNRELDDQLLKRIRVAETLPGVTRVVLDIQPHAEISATQLGTPHRLVVELRAGAKPAIPPDPIPASVSRSMPPAQAAPMSMLMKPVAAVEPPRKAEPVRKAEPPKAEVRKAEQLQAELPKELDLPAMTAESRRAPLPLVRIPVLRPPLPAGEAVVEAGRADESGAAGESRLDTAAARPPASATGRADRVTVDSGKAARPASNGKSSLVRALGLKLNRVVLDPGHGGSDQGTSGSRGLLEKELVLDVAKRLGKLIETRMGTEVIYTRTDDSFVPLEGRTALANERRADLFLSIHANSSPYTQAWGTEVFYLNFTDSRDALDVATRENASSKKSIFELRDLIQKITQHDKAEESREFAGRIQSVLYSFSARQMPAAPPINRGVKTAPFVVLIGATMPSVLAEIGFLSNPREESNLKRGDYRQKLAEALYRGLSRYADGLSHFQMAAAKDE